MSHFPQERQKSMKLQLSISNYSQGRAKSIPKSEEDGDLDEIQIDVSGWSGQFRQVNMPIGGGSILSKVRRKEIMEVNTVESSSDEYMEQSEVHQQQHNRQRSTSRGKFNAMGSNKVRQHQEQQNYDIRSMERSFYRGGYEQRSIISHQTNNMMQSGSGQELNQELMEEIAIVKKQLQDSNYLNNKLRNDRDVLLKKTQEQEFEIENLIVKMSQDVVVLREHYEKRLVMRENIYEEELEEIISFVNSNTESNKKLMETNYRQKYKLEDEVKTLMKQNKEKDAQIEHYIQKYEGDLQNLNKEIQKKIEDHERQKAEEKRKFEEQIKRKEQELQKAKESVEKQKQEIEKELQVYKAEFQKSRMHGSSLEDELNDFNKKIEEKSQELNEKTLEINNKTNELIAKDSMIQEKDNEVQKVTSNLRKLTEMYDSESKKTAALTEEVQKLKLQLEGIHEGDAEQLAETKEQLEQMTYELEFNEDVIKQLKQQHSQKEQQLYTQLENIESIYNDKLQQCVGKLNAQVEGLLKENNELRERLDMSEKQLSEFQSQLEKESEQNGIRGSELENKGEQLKRLQSENSKLSEELQKAKKQLVEKAEHKKVVQAQGAAETNDYQSLKKELQDQKQKNQSLEQELRNMQQIISNSPQLEKMKPALLNRSIQISRMGSLDTSKRDISKHQISLGPIDPQQVEGELVEKNAEIQRLNRKVEELYSVCTNLESKIDLIVLKYPQVDLKMIEGHSLQNLSSNKLIEMCDSEKEEENEINNNPKRKASVLESLQYSRFGGGLQSPVAKKGDMNIQTSFINKPQSSILKRRESLGISRDLSEKSNNSFIKVSHKQKIKELEEIVTQLENRQTAYKEEVDSYQKKVDQLNRQMQKLKAQLAEHLEKPTIGEKTLNQIQTLKINNSQMEGQIVEKSKEISKLSEHITTYKEQNKSLVGEVKDLERQKSANKEKIMVLEIKLNDSTKKLEESEDSIKKHLNEIENLHRKIGDLEMKIRECKQLQQESRMQNRELMFINQQTTNEMKKFKGLSEEYEQRLKKYSGSDATIKQLQKEIQEWNKKNLDQIRTHNHMKLEKDSLEEEMKLVKKRFSEQTRVAIQWEQKAASLERTIEDYKRKESKYRRQVEDAQEDVRKVKSNMKKTEEELHTLQTLQTSWNYEKKKALDEVAQMQDQVTRKDYEYNRLVKELEKYRHRIEENDDARLGKKNQLRHEIEKLEAELIKREKRTVEDAEEIKMLKGRLQFLEKENRKIMEQRNQTYGQKLKHYIDEIASIKKLLDEYQNENTKLKIQNNDFYEENQLLKLSLSKLENKYEQNIENEENILNDLQHYMDELTAANDKNRTYELELDRVEQNCMLSKKELQEERVQGKKKSDKLDSLERTNERLMDEVKTLKVRVSELQTESKIGYNINQKYKILDRKKTEIEEQYKKLKEDYEGVVSVFVYKKEDLEKVVADVKASERKMKEEEITATVDELARTSGAKISRFEAELLEMFNENGRIREQIQQRTDEVAKLKLRVSELEPLSERISQLERQRDDLNEEIKLNKDEIKRRNEKITRDEVYILDIERGLQSKQHQISDHINKINELEMKAEKLQSKVMQLQDREQQTQEKLRALIQKQKERVEQQMHSRSAKSLSKAEESVEMKLFQAELELAKLKEKEQKQTEDYTGKVKNLEGKIEEMADTMKEHEKALQSHYEEELLKCEDTILKLSEQLEDKLQRIDELNEALIILQHQNEDYSKELSNIRYKLDEQTEIFNIEYGKLKGKYKESEDIYNKNLKNLEDELTSMGKELQQLKHSKQNEASNSRLRVSEIEENKKVAKRLEEKLKGREKKIEELKNNIYILEETVLKLRKKESGSEAILGELEEAKTLYHNLDNEYSQAKVNHEKQISTFESIIRELKFSLQTAKEGQEKAQTELEEKVLEYGSMQSELKTTKELYVELQKQIDKRKVNLSNQMEEESNLTISVRTKEARVKELQAVVSDLNSRLDQSRSEVKEKVQEIKRVTQQLKTVQENYDKYISSHTAAKGTQGILKKELEESRNIRNTIESENRALKSELQRLKKNNEDLRTEVSLNQSQIQHTNMTIESMSSRLKESEGIVSAFRYMDDEVMQEFGVGLEQMIKGRYWQQMVDEKQKEINELIEEVQELKFLSDRKLLDYDEMKKQNYELGLKVEDNQILAEQVENLRRICDKLEEEKKSATFKQQLLKMQLSNMAETHQHEATRSKIESILRSCNSPIHNSFAVGATFGESSFGNY